VVRFNATTLWHIDAVEWAVHSIIFSAVMASLEVEPDRRREQSLCLGPSCGRCLKVCPADAVRHWTRDWEACDTHRSPYGFAKLTSHMEAIIGAADAQQKKELLRSETTFNLWQSILRGAGVITGGRRCADVCPVGADYADMLMDALDDMPEDTEAKRLRLVDMVNAESDGRLPDAYIDQQRWIGELPKAKVNST
jgi:epoxyqueuosine reductase